jgi:hypothetical protein
VVILSAPRSAAQLACAPLHGGGRCGALPLGFGEVRGRRRNTPPVSRMAVNLRPKALDAGSTGVADEASSLTGDFGGCHVGMVRRLLFDRPGALYETLEAMIVQLDPFGGQEAPAAILPDGPAKCSEASSGTPVASDPVGRHALVNVKDDGSVRVLDLPSGKETYRYDACPAARAFSFSPDGTLAVAGSFRAGMYVFHLPWGKPANP